MCKGIPRQLSSTRLAWDNVRVCKAMPSFGVSGWGETMFECVKECWAVVHKDVVGQCSSV